MIAGWMAGLGWALVSSVGGSEDASRLPEAASDASPLTLEEVLRSVEERYPLIIASLRERDEAEGARLSSAGGFDPKLSLQGSVEESTDYPRRTLEVSIEQPTPIWGTQLFGKYRLGDGKFPPYDGEWETDPLGELKAGMKIPLWRDGAIDRRRAAVRQADLSVHMAELSVAQQRLEARRAATMRYWEWVAAGAKKTLVLAWLDLAERRDGDIATRVAAGDIPEFEHVENERTVLQRRAAHVTAERDLGQAALELALFLRGPNGDPEVPEASRLPNSLPLLDALEIEDPQGEVGALDRRPDLRRMEAQRARSLVELELAENQRAPAVDLRAAGFRGLGADPESGVEVSLMIDVPILNRAPTGRRDSAEGVVAKTEAQLRLARDRVLVEVRSAAMQMKAARGRAEAVQRELAMAKVLAEGELKRFEAGEGSLLLVNLREQATAEAGLREIDVLLEYHRARAAYDAATATTR